MNNHITVRDGTTLTGCSRIKICVLLNLNHKTYGELSFLVYFFRSNWKH